MKLYMFSLFKQEEENNKVQVPFELNKVLGSQKCSKIIEVSRCRSLILPTDLLKTNKVRISTSQEIYLLCNLSW